RSPQYRGRLAPESASANPRERSTRRPISWNGPRSALQASGLPPRQRLTRSRRSALIAPSAIGYRNAENPRGGLALMLVSRQRVESGKKTAPTKSLLHRSTRRLARRIWSCHGRGGTDNNIVLRPATSELCLSPGMEENRLRRRVLPS